MQHIVCFGDSLTEFGFESGWFSRLSSHYMRKAVVHNCGLSGYNTRWYLDVLRNAEMRACLLPDSVREPLFVTLLLGSNDLATNEQGLPLGEYIANMEAIIQWIHRELRPQCGIFVLTPPPVDQDGICAAKQLSEADRTFTASRLYRAAVLDIVANFQKNHADHHVQLVDTHTALLHHATPVTAAVLDAKWEPAYDAQAPWTRLLVDGLHINEVGGELFYSALIEAIRRSAFAAQLEPAKIRWALPEWREMAAAAK